MAEKKVADEQHDKELPDPMSRLLGIKLMPPTMTGSSPFFSNSILYYSMLGLRSPFLIPYLDTIIPEVKNDVKDTENNTKGEDQLIIIDDYWLGDEEWNLVDGEVSRLKELHEIDKCQ